MNCNIITYVVLSMLFIQSGSCESEIHDRSAVAETLGFETQLDEGLNEIWNIQPDEAAVLDFETAFEGKASARLDRSPGSEGEFSTIGFSVPIETPKGQIKVRAAIKAESIEGMSSLWVRQDSASGMVAYKNLRENSVRSDQDWVLHELDMEIEANAISLSVGVFFAGTGSVYVDNFELFLNDSPVEVDSQLVAQARALKSDSEFASGSGVHLSDLSSVQVQNVSAFVRVWGFLKYHHPNIVGGNVDWDAAFLKALPNVLSLESKASRNQWLDDWIDQFGIVEACNPCAVVSSDIALSSDIDWIRDEAELGEALSSRLRYIRANRLAVSEQHYVKPGTSGQAEFQNEASYSFLENTDSGFRMLAVARYWNMIQYWFPYRDIIASDWEATLGQALSEVVKSQSELDYQLAMWRLIARVEDTHAKLHSHLSILPPTGACDLPIHVRFIEMAPTVVALESAAAQSSDFAIGDVIRGIGGVDVSALLTEMRSLYPASNSAAQNRDMALSLMRGECGPVEVVIERDGQAVTVSGNRMPGTLKHVLSLPRDLPGDTVQILDGNIGYIKLSSVSRQEVAAYLQMIRDTEGLIIDLRNYPSDFMPYLLGQWFVEAPTPFATVSLPNFETPGEFKWQKAPPIPPAASEDRVQLPIIVLVDDVTQSSAEYTAMAFRALPNSIVVGSQTAGADGNISRIILPGQLSTTISGLGVFYPDQEPTQKLGIVPDIYVAPSRAGILEGRDEVLEAALKALAEMNPDG